jgi:hypothetical protein
MLDYVFPCQVLNNPHGLNLKYLLSDNSKNRKQNISLILWLKYGILEPEAWKEGTYVDGSTRLIQ